MKKTSIPQNKSLEESGQLVLGERPIQRENETVLPKLAQQHA